MDGLAALVKKHLNADPFSGVIFWFRAKRADRVKLIFWNGTGLIQFDGCCGAKSWRRATSATTAPGVIASATIRPFYSSLHRRRRTTLVTSPRRERTFVSLMSTSAHNPKQNRDRALPTFSPLGGERAPLTITPPISVGTKV